MLLNKIRDSQKQGIYVLPLHVDTNDVSVLIQHECVAYIPRHLSFTDSEIPKLDDILHTFADTAFIKPPEFSHEKEYRFHYTLVAHGQIIEPLKKFLILDARQLLQYVR